MCGDGTALGCRFGVSLCGKWVWELKDNIDSMFIDLFRVNKVSQGDTTENPLKTDEKGDEVAKVDGEVEYNTSQYEMYEAVKERINAEDAGEYLLRRDDEVDFQIAWGIIREMMSDEKYKEGMLSEIHHSPDAWWEELLITS